MFIWFSQLLILITASYLFIYEYLFDSSFIYEETTASIFISLIGDIIFLTKLNVKGHVIMDHMCACTDCFTARTRWSDFSGTELNMLE